MAPHRSRQVDAVRIGRSFNGRFRDECLNETLLSSISQARAASASRKEDYNLRQLIPPKVVVTIPLEAEAA